MCYNFSPRILPSRPLRRPVTAVIARQTLTADSLAASLDEGQRRAFRAVRQLACERGLPVYLVGGPVRDALLGTPVLDLDFSVEGDAAMLARGLSDLLGGRVTAHARFGTATVSLAQAQGEQSRGRIDLVTARRESYPQPGQLPVVIPGSIGDDLARRDFTINAMALPLSPPGAGVLDPMNGLGDLEAGIVRVLHPLSFVDDPTRMMRAVRYEQRFGFNIEEGTLAGMSRAMSAGYMDAVSGDRWRHELERILEETNPVTPLLRAVELELMGGLHPAFGKLSESNERGMQRLDALRKAGYEIGPEDCLAALFSTLSASEANRLIQRLRLSGRRAALARDTIGLRESEPQIRGSAGCPSELARLLEGREPAAISTWAELTADEGVANALRRYATDLRFVKPELSGTALLGMGVPEGPMVGEILARLRDARLDGTVKSEEEEIALARECVARATAELAN